MIAASTVVMLGLMYLNVYRVDHVFFSEEGLYMASEGKAQKAFGEAKESFGEAVRGS